MKRISIIILICMMAWFFVSNPLVNKYVSTLKFTTLPAINESDKLYQTIVKKADTYEIKPIDAKIDPVWKAIPGYNGMKVDIEASYKNMKKKGVFDEKKLVFTQWRPNVHLEDLSPAPIYRGNPEKPMVSFIINVAWGNEYLTDMLATLKKHRVSASFFLEGNWVKKNPDLAKMIVDAGHEVGNHSYSHPDMAKLTAAQARQQMIKTNEIIEAVTEKKVKWFAPPSGSYREETVKVAHELKMKTVMWTVDTVDWKKPSPDVLINRVISKIDKGSMVLMHPTDATAKSLDRLITAIKQKNLSIGTVSELMNEERIMK
ncbi:polysaccharide deacetylase family protein [Neobacillus thermocopriae]|uniref:Polysaccharide deacetylase family protein n=1 Tax=Neobacillus thermocopriae TaxID=1215031 RepID=A0A6B3TN74_9BACI|nr:polysaccharide deacetylase family protein [Neobacillus thermocopriae]MED3624215.1 polysaccharide deacetylase family protein [Neobacillus thermocopriae]MED3713590.1 polysaccharide deacetylase family protein [Neobacillus thermocopriae]NEX77700.1 polysaccharide deacetylase family protein [Neobacillus thermocopriae]